MGDKGKRDKDKHEDQKKGKLTQKEKRNQKKQNKLSFKESTQRAKMGG